MGSRTQGDFDACLKTADQFFDMAVRIASDNVIDNVLKYRFPFAVNIAIACELYLKAIAVYYAADDTFNKIHDLDELIKDIPNTRQLEIKESFDSRMNRHRAYDLFIKTQNNVFVSWRYPFELNRKDESLDYSGFMVFATILKNISYDLKTTIEVEIGI